MKTFEFKLSALSCFMVAALAGCGGSQPPIGAPGAMAQAHVIVAHLDRGKSWMKSGSKGEDLLYVSNQGNGTVTVYSYESQQLVGTLTGFNQPSGICADDRDVWVSDYGSQRVLEFAHGGTQPIHILKEADYYPFSCAFDPKSGDLAVINGTTRNSNVVIYHKAKGKPTIYTGAGLDGFYTGSYDSKGNLWVNGWSYYSSYADDRYAVLLKGEKQLSAVDLHDCSGYNCGGAIIWSQWVGKSWLVGLDQWHVRRNLHGKLIGELMLHDVAGLNQYFVTGLHDPTGQHFIGAQDYGQVEYWDYPSGNGPTATISEGVSDPFGVVVSFSK
jgi:hypothetical protein